MRARALHLKRNRSENNSANIFLNTIQLSEGPDHKWQATVNHRTSGTGCPFCFRLHPVELTELYLSRIDRLEPQLNSFLFLNREEALQTAKVAEDAVVHGDALGPLHGLPIPIKDTQMTKGLRTTAGSLLNIIVIIGVIVIPVTHGS